MEDRDVLLLADAIVARAAEDYVMLWKQKLRLEHRKGKEIQKAKVEKDLLELELWFQSDWCYALKEEWDADAIIDLCQMKAEREFQKIKRGEDKRVKQM